MFHDQLSHTFVVDSTSKTIVFRYGIEDVIYLWKDMGWYHWLGSLWWCCWPVVLCWYCCLVVMWWYFWLEFLLVCWRWFVLFWWWNVFTKFLLTKGSIIEWYRLMSISAVSIFSKISYIEGLKIMKSWSLCGWRSNIPKLSSK